MNHYLCKILHYLRLFKNYTKKFFIDWNLFGFKIAIYNFIGDYLIIPLYPLKIRNYVAQKKFKNNIEFLMKKYHTFIEEYKLKKIDIGRNDKKIWVIWRQGEKNMPKIIKICVQSIKNHNCGYEVILLDKDNYKKYVELPDFIMENVKKKKITLTHLSDIIRMGLLKKYGGIYVDATVFINSDVFKKFNNIIFNTNKYNLGERKFQQWCGFFIGGETNRLFNFCYDLFIEYWKDYNYLIDYLLIDYAIYICMVKFHDCRDAIQNVTIQNDNYLLLSYNFNKEYNNGDYKKFMGQDFHKITRKMKFNECTKGKKTIYGKFIEEMSP